MEQATKNYSHILILCSTALLLNLAFLSVSYRTFFCSGLMSPHGDIAYNIFTNNSLKSNPKRLSAIAHTQTEEQRLVDYAELPQPDSYGPPTHFRSINDTVGYGVLMGLVWKITKSLRYSDMRWLQILIFCLLMPLIYAIALLMLNNKNSAFLACLALLAFTPLIFMNVRPLRDIWGFYGLVVLLYCLNRSRHSSLSWPVIMWWALCFVICQWLRPTIFFTLLATGPLIFIYARSVIKMWILFLACNLLFFWLPFMLYNKIAYNSVLVSCAGQDLYEGLGEFPNPWKIKMDDDWCNNHMLKEYNIRPGSSNYQQKLSELFWQAVKDRPLTYCLQLLRRSLQLIIFYAMIHEWEEYEHARKHSTNIVVHKWINFMEAMDHVQRKIKFGCIYLMLGWLGLILLWLKKKKFETLLIIIVALSGASKFCSHLETRYLVPHYAFFCLAIGYLLYASYRFVFIHSLFKHFRVKIINFHQN